MAGNKGGWIHSSTCLLPSSEGRKQPNPFIFPCAQGPVYTHPGGGYKGLGSLTLTLSQILVLRRVVLLSDKVSIAYPERQKGKGSFNCINYDTFSFVSDDCCILGSRNGITEF